MIVLYSNLYLLLGGREVTVFVFYRFWGVATPRTRCETSRNSATLSRWHFPCLNDFRRTDNTRRLEFFVNFWKVGFLVLCPSLPPPGQRCMYPDRVGRRVGNPRLAPQAVVIYSACWFIWARRRAKRERNRVWSGQRRVVSNFRRARRNGNGRVTLHSVVCRVQREQGR